MTAHFDTGSPITFVSFEVLNEMGVVDKNAISVSGRRGYDNYEYVNQSIKGTIIDQHSKSAKAINMRTRAVKGWKECPYILLCSKSCARRKELEKNGDNVVCANRQALVGRNIIFDNNLQLTICGSTNKTSIHKKKKLPWGGN